MVKYILTAIGAGIIGWFCHGWFTKGRAMAKAKKAANPTTPVEEPKQSLFAALKGWVNTMNEKAKAAAAAAKAAPEQPK